MVWNHNQPLASLFLCIRLSCLLLPVDVITVPKNLHVTVPKKMCTLCMSGLFLPRSGDLSFETASSKDVLWSSSETLHPHLMVMVFPPYHRHHNVHPFIRPTLWTLPKIFLGWSTYLCIYFLFVLSRYVAHRIMPDFTTRLLTIKITISPRPS